MRGRGSGLATMIIVLKEGLGEGGEGREEVLDHQSHEIRIERFKRRMTEEGEQQHEDLARFEDCRSY